ncbi:MAG: GapA-binding peptide SR1P [Anaerobacillus sp.]
MGVIICQTCGEMEHIEAEKVSTFYGSSCENCKDSQCEN